MADLLTITAADHIFYGDIPERGSPPKIKRPVFSQRRLDITNIRLFDEPCEFLTEHLTASDAESLRLLDNAEVYYLEPTHVLAVWRLDDEVHLYNPDQRSPDYDPSGPFPVCFPGLMYSLPVSKQRTGSAEEAVITELRRVFA